MRLSGPCHPGDVVGCIVGDPCCCLVRGKESETIVVDKDGGCSALASICLHGLFEGLEGRTKDVVERLLVNRHLDGDVGEGSIDFLIWLWWYGGVVARVSEVLCDRTDCHRDVLEYLECKELGRRCR